MKIIQTESIVLKSYSLAEADRIVLFLTQQNGLIRLSVRGAKRMKNRFGGRIEPFTIAEIVFAQKEDAELGRLVQAETVQSYFHLAHKLNAIQALSYFGEVLAVITPPSEPNEKLYRMMRACLDAIAVFSEDLLAIRLVASYFEIWLLRLAGFLPDFRHCFKCQRSIKDQNVFWGAIESQLICLECASGVRRGEVLDSRLHKLLRAALVLPPTQFVHKVQQFDLKSDVFDNITHRLLQKVLEYQPSYWTSQLEPEITNTPPAQAA